MRKAIIENALVIGDVVEDEATQDDDDTHFDENDSYADENVYW